MKELSVEEKAKAYDEAIINGSRLWECGLITRETYEDIFPELKESKDAKIRKYLIESFESLSNACTKNNCYRGDITYKDVLAWLEKQGEQIDFANKEYWRGYREGKQEIIDKYAELEKQGEQEQLYIRFGEIPTDEKSKIFQGEIEVGTENGVSVYPAFKTSEGDIVLGLNLPITKTTLYTQQHLIEYDDRTCYLVKGDYIGKDIDGQPLINNVSIIEKIDTYRVKEKRQGEQRLVEKYNITGIGSKNAQGKLGEMIKNLKPADKVEPKFKVGDWITDGNITIQIKAIENDCYLYCGDCVLYSTKTADKVYHIWTIEDAKDGDILAVEPINDYPSPFITIYKERGLDYFNSYCFIGFDGKFYTGDTGHDIIGIHPATKEQRDALMKAMTDAGYTFDFENKELKKNMLY